MEYDDYDADNLPQKGNCTGVLFGQSTCPIGSVCMSAESGFNWGYEGCFPCNSQTIMMGSHENCEWFNLPEYLHWDTGSSLGTINLAEVCYGQCHGQPELAPPTPEFTCHSSIDCRDGHGLGHWMCNFDHGDNGFCEPCYQRMDHDACNAATFIAENGKNECLKVCVDGNYDDHHPPTELPCSNSLDCRDGHGLGHWMCNFDHGDNGFCESCNHHFDYDACIGSTFITETGTNECFKVCVDGFYDDQPHPEDELPCSTSIDCRDGHGLGHWMCNFDYGDGGFCEPCDHHFDHDACIASTFITENGTNECFKVCVDGNYDDQHPPTELPCSNSLDCRDLHELGHWMCNFDYGDTGFCEPCDHHNSHQACVDSTFITEAGTNECFKICIDGQYEDTTPTPTTTSRTTTQTTTSSVASCGDFDFIHDFLAQTGASHFEFVFTNEQDSFSRKPGRETHGLKRRKIQFTQWIDNIFVKMNKHLEKRKFISCFEDNGKLFDNGMMISKDFDQCPLIEATTIDEYFVNFLSFVDWFYTNCGDAGKLMDKLHNRWNRINEIKMEVHAHVHSKNRDFTVLDLNDYFLLNHGIDTSEMTVEEFTSNFWQAQIGSPPNNGGATWTVTNQCFADDFLVWPEFEFTCSDLSDYECFNMWPEDHIYLSTFNGHGDQ